MQQSFDRIASVAKSLAKPGVLCNNPAHSFIIIDAVDEFYPSDWAMSGQADKDELEIWNDLYLFQLETMLKVYKEMKIEATGKYSIFNNVFCTVIISLDLHFFLNQCLGLMERV